MFELMRTHVVCQLLKALSSTCVMKMKTETVRHVFITAQAVLRDSDAATSESNRSGKTRPDQARVDIMRRRPIGVTASQLLIHHLT